MLLRGLNIALNTQYFNIFFHFSLLLTVTYDGHSTGTKTVLCFLTP